MPAEIGQRRDDADRAVAAHAQIAGVVEENDAGRRLRRDGLFSTAPTMHSLPRGSVTSDVRSQSASARIREPLGHVAAAEIRRPFDDHARRLAGGVGVDDANRGCRSGMWHVKEFDGESIEEFHRRFDSRSVPWPLTNHGVAMNKSGRDWIRPVRSSAFDVVELVRAIGSEIFDAAVGDDDRVFHANIQLFARDP